jgi:hypothetical protein
MKAIMIVALFFVGFLFVVSAKAETQLYTVTFDLKKNFKDSLYGPDELQPLNCRVRFESQAILNQEHFKFFDELFLTESLLLMEIFKENGWQSEGGTYGTKPACGLLFSLNEQLESVADISMGGVTERVAREEGEEDATYFRRVQKTLIDIIANEGIIDPNK